MKKILFVAVLMMIILPSKDVFAFEEPIAGMAVTLDAVKDKPIEKAVAYYSAIYHIDGDLVLAVIDGESEGEIKAFNTNRNGTTDHGLMQINSCNHEWLSEELGITDFYDPIQNIHSGVYILSLLTEKYDSIHRVLMSYNMGETATKRLWNKGIYSSRYSRKITRRLRKIKEDKQCISE